VHGCAVVEDGGGVLAPNRDCKDGEEGGWMYDADSPRVKTGSRGLGGEMKELREGEDGTNIVGIKEVIASV